MTHIMAMRCTCGADIDVIEPFKRINDTVACAKCGTLYRVEMDYNSDGEPEFFLLEQAG